MPPGYDLILEGATAISGASPTRRKSGSARFTYDAASNTIHRRNLCEAIRFPSASSSWAARRKRSPSLLTTAPTRRWTPQILDILKQKHAPATFFVIGSNANRLSRICSSANTTKATRSAITPTRTRIWTRYRTAHIQLELNLTERLFESTLGVKTLLFRPPYGIDHQPETADEVALLPMPQSMGYMLVGARIDPHDWGEPGGVPPPPAERSSSSA